MVRPGRLAFVNDALLDHQSDLLASMVLVLVVSVHVLARLETKVIVPEAAIAGITSSFHSYFRATTEQRYETYFKVNLGSKFARTPTPLMVAWGLMWTMVYILLLVLVRETPAWPNWLSFALMAVVGPAALGVPALVALGAFVAEPPPAQPTREIAQEEED